MNMLVTKHSIVFVGKVKDIKDIFTYFPNNITLLEFIRLHLN